MKVIVTNPELRKDITLTMTVGGSAPYYDRLSVTIAQAGKPYNDHNYCLEMDAEDPNYIEPASTLELTDDELVAIARWANAVETEAWLTQDEKVLQNKILASIKNPEIYKLPDSTNEVSTIWNNKK